VLIAAIKANKRNEIRNRQSSFDLQCFNHSIPDHQLDPSRKTTLTKIEQLCYNVDGRKINWYITRRRAAL
jgi:hypothetical protein